MSLIGTFGFISVFASISMIGALSSSTKFSQGKNVMFCVFLVACMKHFVCEKHELEIINAVGWTSRHLYLNLRIIQAVNWKFWKFGFYILMACNLFPVVPAYLWALARRCISCLDIVDKERRGHEWTSVFITRKTY